MRCDVGQSSERKQSRNVHVFNEFHRHNNTTRFLRLTWTAGSEANSSQTRQYHRHLATHCSTICRTAIRRHEATDQWPTSETTGAHLPSGYPKRRFPFRSSIPDLLVFAPRPDFNFYDPRPGPIHKRRLVSAGPRGQLSPPVKFQL